MTPTSKLWVAGLLFSYNRSRVLLIRKKNNIPGLEWMGGQLNGIGGKVEKDESVEDAMCREFDEETGLTVSPWHPFLVLEIHNVGEVHFFRAFSKEFPRQDELIQKTDETIGVYDIHRLNRSDVVVPNIFWIMRLALDTDVIHAKVLVK